MSEHWTPAKSNLDTGKLDVDAKDLSPDTKVLLSKLEFKQGATKPLTLPTYHSSTYKIDSVKEYLDIIETSGYIYSRLCNPNCEQVECLVNGLEEGAGCLAFCSGMAAVTTAILGLCKTGDHIIAQNPIYSGTHRFLTKYATKYGMELTYVPAGCDVSEFEKHIKPSTKLLIGETPCNPDISILDVEKFGTLGKKTVGIYTMLDATYASPYLMQPIKYGVDIVLHSATKYLGGHSDLIAGVLTTRSQEMWKELNVFRSTLGNLLGPSDAVLLTRGIKTLPLRMKRICDNAMGLAEFLENQPQVKVVRYPGLKSHPGHEVAKKQMKMYGGMIAFEMKGGLEAARQMVEAVQVVQLSVSLGGVESLMEHPATMTHGPMVMTPEERREARISDGLIRFSVGLESLDDLVKDVKRALEKVNTTA